MRFHERGVWLVAVSMAFLPGLAQAQANPSDDPEPARCAVDDPRCIERADRRQQPVVFTERTGEVITDREDRPVTDLEAARRRLEEPGQGAWRTFDFVPGSDVVFAADFEDVPVGRFPSGRLEYVSGNAQVVERHGRRMMEFTGNTTFRVLLDDSLPDDFTLEFHARTATPNQRINVFFTQQEGPIGRYEHPYLSLWRGAGLALKNRPISSTDSYNAIADTLVPIRFRVEGDYAVLYLNEVKAANVPTANIPRTDVFEFVVNANSERPAILDDIVVATGGTPPLESLDASGAFVTRGITFEDGGDALRPESTPVLRQIQRALEERTDLAVVVEDHTAADPELSGRRARAIVRYLVEAGVDGARLEAVGTEPEAGGAGTPEEELESRVVVIRPAG